MSRKKWLTLGCTVTAVTLCAALLVVVTGAGATFTRTPLDRSHAERVASSTGPDVLLITVDTLRADHVGMYGYPRRTTPAIDAFFRDGVVFQTAYAPTPSTTPSVVSFLTGLYPHHHGVRLLCQKISPDVVTFVDHLRRAGYQTAGIVSNAMLADEACGLGSRFDFYDDRVDEPEPFREEMFERKASRTTDAAIDWLTRKRQSGRPHFMWVHYIDPHGPYRAPADKPIDFAHETVITIDPNRVPTYAREAEVTDGNEYIDRYDEEIAYTDRELGRLLDAYQQLGLADEAVVIFTSDHGESMMEHEHWFRHQMNVYEEMVRVPLAIRLPGFEPSRVAQAVSLVDIAPTILELASLPPPPGWDGVSLLSRPRHRDILCEGRAKGGGLWRGLVRRRRKTAVRHGMSNTVREARAFDLAVDPLELRPFPVDPADPIFRMLERIVSSDPDPGGVPEQYAAGQLPAPSVAPTTDPKLREALRSLGYIGE